MKIEVLVDPITMNSAAANFAAEQLRTTLQNKATARIVVATGASQIGVLQQLTSLPSIDWSRVEAFHLDEYIGLDRNHPASFCRYLDERFVSKVNLRSFHFLEGAGDDPQTICDRASTKIREQPIDIALIGIGENGHLAFNDPPADFETRQPYIIVQLDEACRKQQVGEGWFTSLDEVPQEAVSMSIHQIMQSRTIICSVPDLRKSSALKAAAELPITPYHPATILQQHPRAFVFCDRAAASELAAATC